MMMAGNICQIPLYQGGSTKGAKGGWAINFFIIYENNCVFNKNTQSSFVTVVLDGVLEPPHLTVPLYLCSSGSNARGESRAREGRRVSSKSPSRVRDGDVGVAEKNRR